VLLEELSAVAEVFERKLDAFTAKAAKVCSAPELCSSPRAVEGHESSTVESLSLLLKHTAKAGCG
jgi:hypothetical protein